jgi:tetratricopeptide (TPR) repeat protein
LSDLYSLGAVLYCLLVGRPPFQAANVIETLKQVMDQEPVPPRQLIRSIDRDLETICLKCLAKEPYRRYPSARALAEDLGRFLAEEPVHARPVGPVARLWRWCHRKPLLAGASAAALLSLVAGSVVSTYFAIAESRRAEEARANAAEAEQHFVLARDAVDKLYTRVSESVLLHRPGMQSVRHDLLREALSYYLQFLARRGADATVREDLALAHFRVALITEELESPARALPSFRRALELHRALLAEHPADRALLDSTADMLAAVGRVHHRMNESDAAYDALIEAVALRERLVAAEPENREFRRTLANSVMNVGLAERGRGRLDAAQQWFEKAQSMRLDLARVGDDRPELRRDMGIGHFNLGTLLLARAEPAADAAQFRAARERIQNAAAIFETLPSETGDDTDNAHRLVYCYDLLGDTDKNLEQWDDAIRWYEKASSVAETLVQRNPDVPAYQADRAGILLRLGKLYRARENYPLAMSTCRQAAAILKPLVENNPDTAHLRFDYAVALREVSTLHPSDGTTADAEQSLGLSIQYLRELVARFPDDAQYAAELKLSEGLLGAEKDEVEPRPN